MQRKRLDTKILYIVAKTVKKCKQPKNTCPSRHLKTTTGPKPEHAPKDMGMHTRLEE